MSLTASDLSDIERLLSAQNAILTLIAESLDALAKAQLGAQPAPDLRYPLENYKNFDFVSIGAEVAGQDRHGPTGVTWGGRLFGRRNGAGKFGRAIWFSRKTGEEDGHRKYERLVTFKDQDDKIEPLAFDPPGPAQPAAPAWSTEKLANMRNGDPASAQEFHTLAREAIKKSRVTAEQVNTLLKQASAKGWRWAINRLELSDEFPDDGENDWLSG